MKPGPELDQAVVSAVEWEIDPKVTKVSPSLFSGDALSALLRAQMNRGWVWKIESPWDLHDRAAEYRVTLYSDKGRVETVADDPDLRMAVCRAILSHAGAAKEEPSK